MRSQPERLVELPDGTKLWTATSGGGTPVVCCHGGPGLWDYLADLAALLDDSHLVVRFDQRGCGRSTGVDGPFTVAQAVGDLEQLRQALDLDRWAVLGHSWGAELALRYAAAHPGRTTAVAYLGGVGAGGAWREPYLAERNRRLGAMRIRLCPVEAKSRPLLAAWRAAGRAARRGRWPSRQPRSW